jgi:hypothetical protein
LSNLEFNSNVDKQPGAGVQIPALPFTQRILGLSIFRAGLGAGITNGYYFDTFLKGDYNSLHP